jgi:DNA polymerase-3 subunit delta
MKLSAREAGRYFKSPETTRAGLLIYGADPMRVAMRRADVLKALLGEGAEEEMRLSRLPAADLRKDAASLLDEVKAQGFFPGPRAVFVEGASDTVHAPIDAAMAEWAPGDAQIIVTAGQLNARSKLRKLFEGHSNAYAVGLYNDPPDRGEVEDWLREAGLRDISPEAMNDILALSRALDPGDFRQTLEKLALYKYGDSHAVIPAEVALAAPATIEAEVDDILHMVAEAKQDQIGPMLTRLSGQGVQPVGLCIQATRHFRTLHAAASDPGGVNAGLSRSRPPVFGPRRDKMARQAQNWGARRLETALSVLLDTDLALRSAAQTAPQMALVERALIRIAMMGARR